MKPPTSPSEQFMLNPHGGNLPTITPVQRAQCRILDGVPLGELAEDPAVVAMCGGVLPPPVPPSLLMIICAIRAGKSQLAAGFGIRMAFRVDLSKVRVDEPTPRIPIISVEKRNARAVYQWTERMLTNSKRLASRIRRQTAETITVRRDDGRDIDIEIVAGAREGTTFVGTWLAGAIFDECTLMLGGDDSVINIEDSLKQTDGRMLPGAQTILIGSSMAPPRGFAYDLLHQLWGHPDGERVALWSTGPEMAPFRYTPEYCAKLKLTNPTLHRVSTERSFLDPETSFLSSEVISRQTREAPPELPPTPGRQYVAATDPATRHNAWTFVVIEAVADTLPITYRVVCAREWIPTPGERLSPKAVVKEICDLVLSYGLDMVHSDGHMADSLADLAETQGVVWCGQQMAPAAQREGYFLLGTLLSDRLLELPPVPHMRADLLAIKKRVTPDGVAFFLPENEVGRHCDYAPSLVRAVRNLPEAVVPDAVAEIGEMDHYWARVKERIAADEASPMLSKMRRLLA